MSFPLGPHGDVTDSIERLVSQDKAGQALASLDNAPRIVVPPHQMAMIRAFASGVLAPLAGPMNRRDFDLVLDKMVVEFNRRRIAWGVPVILPLSSAEAAAVRNVAHALLVDSDGDAIGTLDVEDVYEWDKARHLEKVYGVANSGHPDAQLIRDDQRAHLVGGTIHVFPSAKTTPASTVSGSRAKLAASGWEAALVFPVRGALTRAHEHAIIATARRLAEAGTNAGFAIAAFLGEEEDAWLPADARLKALNYVKSHGLLGDELKDRLEVVSIELPRVSGTGPREALMRAIACQNFGFTHIIYPGDSEADVSALATPPGQLHIPAGLVGRIAYFDELRDCALVDEHADKGWKPIEFKAAAIRERLENGQLPDERHVRPEVASLLLDALNKRSAAERNVIWHPASVTHDDRVKLNGHKGATLWFTGLSGSGKSTLANAVAGELHKRGVRTYVLDGDNIRTGLNKDLSFSDDDRIENIRRIGEVAKLFTDAGVVNLSAFISPFASDRKIAADLQPSTFLEVYCEADIATCEQRDPKGLYKKARAGQIKHFTGIDSPYEPPANPAVVVNTSKNDLETGVQLVVAELERRGIIPATNA